MRYSSTEVRWFLPGAPPVEIRQWFFRDSPPPAAVRTDLYLSATGTTLNIKLREGRVEVKQRQGTPVRRSVTPACTGWREEWVKWSFGLDAAESYVRTAEASPEAWIPVEKKRFLHTFGWLDGSIREEKTGAWLPAGCNAELTELKVGGRQWYSIGLEAFGERERQKDILETTLIRLWSAPAAPVLSLPQSFGYAAWISEFLKKMI